MGVVKQDPLETAGENVKWCCPFGKQLAVLRVYTDFPYDSATPLQRNVNIRPRKNLYMNVHARIIHSNEEVAAIPMSIT